MKNTVIELFAGVGGFRVGMNEVTLINNLIREQDNFNFVWANQWEPSTKIQPAYDCYVSRFGKSKNHVCEDISKIHVNDIPNHSLLVGGFPCQDYSVARGLKGEKGINGKKGVLWWEILRIVKHFGTPFILLENVDRLLKSPSTQRGRDFAVILRSLYDLGYNLEWRVINAAEHGFYQRRRRVFIFAYKKTTNYSKSVSKYKNIEKRLKVQMFENAFPSIERYNEKFSNVTDYEDIYDVSDNYDLKFNKSGYMINGKIYMYDYIPKSIKEKKLSGILEKNVDKSFNLTDEQQEKMKYMKGKKKIKRIKPNGEEYFYSEGKMTYPENIALPGRTMLTSEGTVNRSTHIVNVRSNGNKRFITPIEAERLNDFPDDWTKTGMSKRQRYFMMGNALVCGVVQKLGQEIKSIISEE